MEFVSSEQSPRVYIAGVYSAHFIALVEYPSRVPILHCGKTGRVAVRIALTFAFQRGIGSPESWRRSFERLSPSSPSGFGLRLGFSVEDGAALRFRCSICWKCPS